MAMGMGIGGNEGAQQVAAPPGQRAGQHAGGQGQHDALGHEQTDHLPSAGAKRAADRQFAL